MKTIIKDGCIFNRRIIVIENLDMSSDLLCILENAIKDIKSNNAKIISDANTKNIQRKDKALNKQK